MISEVFSNLWFCDSKGPEELGGCPWPREPVPEQGVCSLCPLLRTLQPFGFRWVHRPYRTASRPVPAEQLGSFLQRAPRGRVLRALQSAHVGSDSAIWRGCLLGISQFLYCEERLFHHLLRENRFDGLPDTAVWRPFSGSPGSAGCSEGRAGARLQVLDVSETCVRSCTVAPSKLLGKRPRFHEVGVGKAGVAAASGVSRGPWGDSSISVRSVEPGQQDQSFFLTNLCAHIHTHVRVLVSSLSFLEKEHEKKEKNPLLSAFPLSLCSSRALKVNAVQSWVRSETWGDEPERSPRNPRTPAGLLRGQAPPQAHGELLSPNRCRRPGSEPQPAARPLGSEAGS